MKINWGWGIVIGMTAFIGFILFFITKMVTDKKYDYDLVTEEYYKKEMYYQQEIDAEKNLQLLSTAIKSKKTEEGWLLLFPEDFPTSGVDGTVNLYRTSNKKLDFKLPLVLEDQQLLIPDHQLLEGRWNIIIDWTYNENNFLYKESITY